MRKMIFSVIFILGVLGLSGCEKDNKEVKDVAQENADIFMSGDMEEINSLIFGYDEWEVDEEVKDFLGEETETQENGVVACILSRTTIKVKKVTDADITYDIEAPDLSGIFLDTENVGEISEEEFKSYLQSYIEQAKIQKSTVTVSYKIEDGKVVADFKNEKFVNAITGGLLEAYQAFYQNMLTELKKGVE